jgi:hypothetical protein
MIRHLSLLKQDGVGQVRLGGHLSQLQERMKMFSGLGFRLFEGTLQSLSNRRGTSVSGRKQGKVFERGFGNPGLSKTLKESS